MADYEEYHFYQNLKICPQCKKNRLLGEEKLCLECKAYAANKASERRKRNNDRAKELRNESYKRIAEYRNQNCLCTKCGKPMTDNHKMCPACRSKNTIKSRNRRNIEENRTEYRLKNGLCRFCDNERIDGYKVCEFHRNRLTELSRSEKQMQNRQNLIISKILF